ncbi:MAG: hypothetical protein MRJ92_04190 [Nitrospira sp.]|nr:hypothetical protein [Nitrospira sp.]
MKLTILMITHDINMIRSRVDQLVLLKTKLFAARAPQGAATRISSVGCSRELVITDKDFVIVRIITTIEDS